jgi:hypothetical protein
VSALVFLVKLVCFVRSEGCVVVASEDARFEPASSEETEDTFEVKEKCVFVASLDGVAEEVFAAGVSERDKLSVPFYALWADEADVVIADAFADRPLAVSAWIGGVGWLVSLESVIGDRDGGDTGVIVVEVYRTR